VFIIFSYFLPGGAVDRHEHLTTAAIRETKEEAGIDVNLTGVLSINYSPHGTSMFYQRNSSYNI